MLPVSGAEQLQASGASNERPVTSASTAYSPLVRPAPCGNSFGSQRFHSPRARASSFSYGGEG